MECTTPKQGGKRIPGLHPYKASHRHQYWFIDGRQLDVRVDGIKWWSLIILEGYSRTMLAGAIAPTEATWVALIVLYTACLRYGIPEALISDSGGAYTSNDFEVVCTRLQLRHETIVSTQGEGSALHVMLFLENILQVLFIFNGLRRRHCQRALLGYHYRPTSGGPTTGICGRIWTGATR
jgi:transposase InsO family protein